MPWIDHCSRWCVSLKTHFSHLALPKTMDLVHAGTALRKKKEKKKKKEGDA
jgi:hypothetical protein